MSASVARLIWQFGEPVHAVTYFAPETRAATDALGLKGGWMSYFGCRAAPLGAVGAPVVAAVFYNFHPDMVGRAIPDAWSYASPARLLEARWEAMDRALRRLLGDELEAPSTRRLADLAVAAAVGCDCSGRALAMANAAVTPPDEPHLALWQALATLREHRGDGHVISLVGHGIGPCEALVLQAATGRSPADGLRSNRGWSDADWTAASDQLVTGGLIDASGAITVEGRARRQEVEDETDRLAASAVDGIGTAGAQELVAGLRPLAERVMSAGAVPASNNMGVPWPPTTP